MFKADAAVVFSDRAPEPIRAQRLKTALSGCGLTAVLRPYTLSQGFLDIAAFYKRARTVLLLASGASKDFVADAFVTAVAEGYKPVPIQCEPHAVAPLIKPAEVLPFFQKNTGAAQEELQLLTATVGRLCKSD
ncbi:MAG TPA: hypothetical protein VD907_03675 [Verrucomicrobiae bacterium]|nr:hypothetical protein [Verrucomicrobiae bacterium]